MDREDLLAEQARLTAKLRASTHRDGSVRPGAGERVLALRQRMAEVDAALSAEGSGDPGDEGSGEPG